MVSGVNSPWCGRWWLNPPPRSWCVTTPIVTRSVVDHTPGGTASSRKQAWPQMWYLQCGSCSLFSLPPMTCQTPPLHVRRHAMSSVLCLSAPTRMPPHTPVSSLSRVCTAPPACEHVGDSSRVGCVRGPGRSAGPVGGGWCPVVGAPQRETCIKSKVQTTVKTSTMTSQPRRSAAQVGLLGTVNRTSRLSET